MHIIHAQQQYIFLCRQPFTNPSTKFSFASQIAMTRQIRKKILVIHMSMEIEDCRAKFCRWICTQAASMMHSCFGLQATDHQDGSI